MTTIQEVLARTAAILRDKWTRSVHGAPIDGGLCALMALDAAFDELWPIPMYSSYVVYEPRHALRRRIIGLLFEQLPHHAFSASGGGQRTQIMDFNDEQTEVAPVIALYERALAKIAQEA